MAALRKAKLQAVEANEDETPKGPEVPVQFNPTTLTLKLRNSVEGGRSNGKQRRQQTGASSNTLSMDLVFDTADEGTDAAPVSVRTKTAIVEQFAVPEKDSSDPPPRLKFIWKDLILTGIVEEVGIEFDLFAADGTPLRAKVNLSLKEQEPAYQFKKGGAGAKGSGDSEKPGGGAAASQPGTGTNGPDSGAPESDRVAPALDGESPAEFADRMGLDPTAWRGLDADLSLGLGFEAGIEVGFSASIGASLGIGVSAGFQAGIGVSFEASLGLDASVSAGLKAGANAGAGASFGGNSVASADAQGKAMSELGGIAASVDLVSIAKADAAAQGSAQAFDQPGPPSVAVTSESLAATAPGAAPMTPRIERVPLSRSGPRSYSERAAEPATPPMPAPDPRAVSFGSGVPLQPLRASIRATQTATPCIRGSSQGSAILAPVQSGGAEPPWEALPFRDRARTNVDAMEHERRANPCSAVATQCGGKCR